MTDTRPQTMPPREVALELFYDLEQQACAVSALGELLRAADSDKIDEFVPHGVGVLLGLVSSKMFETMSAGLIACHSPLQTAAPT